MPEVKFKVTPTRPPETYPNPEVTTNGGGQRISLDNGIDSQLGDQSHFVSDRQEDELSLQPGQRERHNIGLLSSEGSVQSEDFEPHISSQRFQRYTDKGANDIYDPPLTHDILREMFGEDASTESHNNSGLLLDKTQIDIIRSSLDLKCQISCQRIKTLTNNLSQFKKVLKNYFKCLVLMI